MMKNNKTKLFSFILSIIMLFTLTACNNGGEPLQPPPEKDIYTVGNNSFGYPECNTEGRNIDGTTEYFIYGSSYCSVKLLEFTATIKIYLNSNQIIEERINRQLDINAYDLFYFEIPIYKSIFVNISDVKVEFSGKSYEYNQETIEKHNVTFVKNNGIPNDTIIVNDNKTVKTPEDPIKYNYNFTGWYTDSSFFNKYDFSNPVTSDLTLYAKYELDAVSITNEISTSLIKSIVKIYNKSYNTILGIETNSTTGQGSGFCFHIQDGRYYILTNSHVALKELNYDNQSFIIEDYQGNQYEGHLYKNPNKTYSAVSAAYDLACLWFKPTSSNVKKLTLSTTNPLSNSDVISLGAPKNQSNSITFGKTTYYQTVTLSSDKYYSNVQFPVITHSAFINNGSSGGPLLNSFLEVVGVNYASRKSNENYVCSFAIPIEKVREFLTKYVYN